MKKQEDRPLTKHTVNLYEGQFDKLCELHPRLGGAKVIRTLLDDYLRQIAEKTAQVLPPIPATQVDIKEII